MKEIKQQNIVNFVDSFLVGEAELWVRWERERGGGCEREGGGWMIMMEERDVVCCLIFDVCGSGGDGVPGRRFSDGRGDRDSHEREPDRSCLSRG